MVAIVSHPLVGPGARHCAGRHIVGGGRGRHWAVVVLTVVAVVRQGAGRCVAAATRIDDGPVGSCFST